MKHVFISIAVTGAVMGALVAAGPANAQTNAMQTVSSVPTVNPVEPTDPSHECREAAAIRSKLEAYGFEDVAAIERDSTGVWRTHATRYGTPLQIVVDKGGRVHTQH